ncbi:Factor arrest protein 11 [Borealophlyctis nickersoniae]|nr:Factor arrest protein 11 [Borealophlyctis nickersoniae]
MCPPPPTLPPTPPPPPYVPDRPLPATPDALKSAANGGGKSSGEADSGGGTGTAGEQSKGAAGAEGGSAGGFGGSGAGTAAGQTESLTIQQQIRQAMRNLPSRQKPAYYDFVYADRDTLENEINEFYNYQDNPYIQEGRMLFESSFEGEWMSAGVEKRSDYVELLLEALELKNPEARYTAAKKLLYISQGVFGECPTTSAHLSSILETNTLLFRLGGLPYFYRSLKVVSATLDLISRSADLHWSMNERQAAMDLANVETSIYLSLTYMMVECNLENAKLVAELADTQPPLAAYLFNLVAQLAEGNRKHYPVKKLLLLLWKVLLATVGGTDRLRRLKNASRALHGLPSAEESAPYAKATPQDYRHFQVLSAHRYPTYVTPEMIPNAPPGASSLSQSDPLPANIRRQMLQPGTVQPFVDEVDCIPTAIKECVDVYGRHVYVSLSSVQIAKEKTMVEQKAKSDAKELEAWGWRRDSKFEAHGEGEGLSDMNRADLERIDTLYEHLLPHMATHVGMLVRLLYYVNLGNTTTSPNGQSSEGAEAGKGPQQQQDGAGGPGGAPTDSTPLQLDPAQMTPQQKQDAMDRVDLNRHKEVVTKAVSGILLVLLKAMKCHHILKLEYISQLLVDNNCAILILKMLSMWFQNPTPAGAGAGAGGGGGAGTAGNRPGAAGGSEGANGPTWGDGAGAAAANAGMNGAAAGMAAGWLKARDEPDSLNFFTFCRDPGAAPEEFDGSPVDSQTDETPAAPNGQEVPPEDRVELTSTDNGTSEVPKPTPTDAAAPEPTNPTPPASSTSPVAPTAPLPIPIARRDSVAGQTPAPIKSCFRNFYTSINLLRILQKLTKRKTHRMLALVQWKASAVLKRVIKVNSVALQLYALKLLKGQVPYLGRKWRSSNMKVITGIYLHLRPYLRDDYLSGDVDMDVEDALAQEQYLRGLIVFHHQRLYPDVFPASAASPDGTATNAANPPSQPPHRRSSHSHDQEHLDDLDHILNMSRRDSYDASNPHHASLLHLTTSKSYHDRLNLDENFMENYEEWLVREVYEPDYAHNNNSPTSAGWGDYETPSSPRTLFSATQRFNKELFGDYYDDQEWEWDDGDNTGWIGDSGPEAEQGVDEWRAFAVEEGSRGWGWDSDNHRWKGDKDEFKVDFGEGGSEEIKSIMGPKEKDDESDGSGGEDSSYGSWSSDESEEESQSGKGKRKVMGDESEGEAYFWPDEAPVQDAYVEVFEQGLAGGEGSGGEVGSVGKE